MAFSIWEYLRERARNATLAGIQDALDIAEDGDFEGAQKAAAHRLTTRLSGQAVVVQLPEPESVTTEQRAPEQGKVNPPPPIRGRTFGEGLETAQARHQAPAQTPVPGEGPDPFAERLTAALPKPEPARGPEPQDRRGPTRNGRLNDPAPALSEFDPPPAAQPGAPERRKRGRPRKDQGG
jgi:hypothetical protein